MNKKSKCKDWKIVLGVIATGISITMIANTVRIRNKKSKLK